MEMSTFILLIGLIIGFGTIGILFLNAIKNAPLIDDDGEPFYHYSRNTKADEELDPTELFQSMKSVDVDTSTWNVDTCKKFEEDNLWNDIKENHYCITLSEKEKSNIQNCLRIIKIQILFNPKKFPEYTTQEIDELINLLGDEKWKFEH
jgi:hypothetical protein